MATLGCMLTSRPEGARGPLSVLGLAWMLMVAAGGSAIELVLGMKPASLPEMATALLVAGRVLSATLSTRRDPPHLSDQDLQQAAAQLGVPLACVRAVRAVESRGCGFLADGRAVMLFERHIFWQRLKRHGIDPAPFEATHPNIVSRTAGGYRGGTAEYVRLALAERIHPSAAWESASWGAFQVMGYHWQWLGYRSVDALVACMQASEQEQLDVFVRFVAADPALVAALKSRKWAQFARRYNGPAYARHLYDVKLARAVTVLAALALALLIGVTMALAMRALRAERDNARQALADAQLGIAARERIIKRLRQDVHHKAVQQARLDTAHSAIAEKLSRLQQHHRKLIDENATLRQWAATALPADIRRLHASATCASARDYLKRLPASDAVPAAGDGPAHQRRVERRATHHHRSVGHVRSQGGYDHRVSDENA
ncbi:hypothetical protein DFQ28_010633 [Apophysomyces sp. BC1034]|nr:hypothetical protein DFQ28_010633 [Apophysomyces sp. BC1034]